jgi:hypothetical protein
VIDVTCKLDFTSIRLHNEGVVECDPEKALSPTGLKRAIRDCLERGSVVFSSHCRRRMDERNIIETDVVNVLEHGRSLQDPMWDNWRWRYRVETANIGVVITFEPEAGDIDELIVVTTFRNRRRSL